MSDHPYGNQVRSHSPEEAKCDLRGNAVGDGDEKTEDQSRCDAKSQGLQFGSLDHAVDLSYGVIDLATCFPDRHIRVSCRDRRRRSLRRRDNRRVTDLFVEHTQIPEPFAAVISPVVVWGREARRRARSTGQRWRRRGDAGGEGVVVGWRSECDMRKSDAVADDFHSQRLLPRRSVNGSWSWRTSLNNKTKMKDHPRTHEETRMPVRVPSCRRLDSHTWRNVDDGIALESFENGIGIGGLLTHR